MNIHIEGLGVIQKGDVILNDLTIFCGSNNTGKTYAMYALYGLLNRKFDMSFKFIEKIVDELVKKNIYECDLKVVLGEHLESMVQQINKELPRCLSNIFGVTVDEFSNTKFQIVDITLDKVLEQITTSEKIQRARLNLGSNTSEWILDIERVAKTTQIIITLRESRVFPHRILIEFISDFFARLLLPEVGNRCFLLPAERAGLNLFFKELSSIRNRLLHHAQKDNIKPLEVLQDILTSRYAEPISDYIEYLGNLTTIKSKKADYPLQVQNIQKKIIGGKYDVDRQGEIFFLPYRSNGKKIPLHFTSSTVKTLFGLVFYLEHYASKGDWLMIDEPELNLHPDSQRNLARLLAQLVNKGIKIIISTHSPYLVREFNNLIMLNKTFDDAEILRKKYGYDTDESLDLEKVSAYLFDKATIKKMEINSDEGIIADTFDQVINRLNQSSDHIYFASTRKKE